MEKELPTIDIRGTVFTVDVFKNELREKANPDNVMSVSKMDYKTDSQGYYFNYDINTKNFPIGDRIFDLEFSEVPAAVHIPDLVHIDPENMAKKYGLTLEQIKGKSDFELSIIPDSSLDLRWNKGVLPTIDIAGHLFYVDLEMDKLRPKDDFKSKGIDLKKIGDYLDRERGAYIIPYNPTTREFQQDDIYAMTELPKDTIVIQFPPAYLMDKIGLYKRGNKSIPKIENQNFDMHFSSKILPWEETNVIDIIKLNVAEQLRPKEQYIQKNSFQDNLYRIPTDICRTLPIITIHGTKFLVDVNQLELREKENSENTIPFSKMRERPGDGYEFLYSPERKNIGELSDREFEVVEIPDLVKLDPKGMAKKYNIPIADIKDMNDFKIMVDQAGYERIANKHVLPTIDIAGHLFYIDMEKDRLLPKDDIWSRGIIFSELEHYYSHEDSIYTIPYNTSTRTFQEISMNSKDIPADLIVIQIPDKNILNPIARNKQLDFDQSYGLKTNGFEQHFKAEIIPWVHTRLAETIQKNQKIGEDQKKEITPISDSFKKIKIRANRKF